MKSREAAGVLCIKLVCPARDDSTVGVSFLSASISDCSANLCLNMPRLSIDLNELERGARAGQVTSVVLEAVAPGTGQDTGGGSNLEGTGSTTIPRAAVEDDIGPGK